MSSGATMDSVRLLAGGLERREQVRSGVNREIARERVASRLGLAPGTLYNLARDRLKRLDADVRTVIAAYAARDLEAEIASLTADLEIAHRLGGSPDHARVQALGARLAHATTLYEALRTGAPAHD